MPVSNINKGNKSLEFIEKRIKNNKYRGVHISQHNRYEMKDLKIILEFLRKFTSANKFLHIRTTDTSKRKHNTPEEFEYAKFCNEIKTKTGIGSQDAMRKNLFVDFNRMGFLDRYDKNFNLIEPFEKKKIVYVSLSEKGKKFLDSVNIREQYFIFSAGLNKLFGSLLNILFQLLSKENFDLDSISLYEFIYFVSAVGIDTDYSISIEECYELIKDFRNLGNIQKEGVTNTLKQEMDPALFLGDKLSKRDFHNWKNEADQIFGLLNTTVYFEVRNKIKLVLNTGPNSFTDETQEKRLNRSLASKTKYFEKHSVTKIPGFELHHVVPLELSESIEHFKLLDSWANLVYIDAFSHAKITQNKNRNIVINFINEDVTLSDYSENQVYLENMKNVSYSTKNQIEMKQYNRELLAVISN